MENDLVIRPLTEELLDKVHALAAACFSQPWSRDALYGLLNHPQALVLVAVEDGKVAGYINMGLVCDEGNINTIAVAAGYRRRGVGRALLEQAAADAGARGINALFLEVRRSNHAAQNFYRKHGFTVLGHRKNFYQIPREDAILMKLELRRGNSNEYIGN